MAAFCSNCGAPATGRFCAACGAAFPAPSNPVQPRPFQAQPFQAQSGGPYPVAPARAGGGSVAKILLIVVVVIFVIGALGVAGLVYVGYLAKQTLAEFKQEYGITNSGSASNLPPVNFPAPKGSGCPVLDGQEASRILRVALERV